MLIDRNFLFFLTRSAFEKALSTDSIKPRSIVFIAEDHVLWTHGVIFGGAGSYLDDYATKDYVQKIINSIEIEIDSVLSDTSKNPVQNKVIAKELDKLREMLKVVKEFKIEVVDSLDDVINPDPQVIYLVKSPDDEILYTQYIYVNNEWVSLGSQKTVLDLSNYYTKNEIDDLFQNYDKEVDSKLDDLKDEIDFKLSEIDLSDFYTKSEINDRLYIYSTKDYVEERIRSYYKDNETTLWEQIEEYVDLRLSSLGSVGDGNGGEVNLEEFRKALITYITSEIYRNVYNKEQVDELISNLNTGSNTPNITWEQITNYVNEKLDSIQSDLDVLRESLINYVNQEIYKNTYTQEEINQLIQSMRSFQVVVVNSLDDVDNPDSTTVYLIKDEEDDQVYIQYIYSPTQGWIKLGSSKMTADFADYYTKDEVNSRIQHVIGYVDIKFEDYYTKLEVNEKLRDFYNKSEIDSKFEHCCDDSTNKLWKEIKDYVDKKIDEAIIISGEDGTINLDELKSYLKKYIDERLKENGGSNSNITWEQISDYINEKLEGFTPNTDDLRESLINYINLEIYDNVYNKDEINELINNIRSFNTEVVDSIESVINPNTTTIYLVPDPEDEGSYIQYIYSTTQGWIRLGSSKMTVDLEDYYTKSEVDSKLKDINGSIDLKFADYYTKLEVNSKNNTLWDRVVEYVNEKIANINTGGSDPSNPGDSNCTCDLKYQPKNIVLEEVEYAALKEYEDNAIYFVLEPLTAEPTTWTFGNKFPITFTENWAFGGTFPLTLN